MSKVQKVVEENYFSIEKSSFTFHTNWEQKGRLIYISKEEVVKVVQISIEVVNFFFF